MALRTSITINLTGYLLAVSIVPLLVFGVTSYELARRAIVRLASDSNVRLLTAERDYLVLQLEQVASLATNIAGLGDMEEALAAPRVEGSAPAAVAQARMDYILSGYSRLKGLVSIDVLAPRGRRFHVGDALEGFEERAELRRRLYEATLASRQAVVWHGVEDNVNAASVHPKVLVATRLIRRVEPHSPGPEPAGMVVINYAIDHLYRHFRGVDLGPGGYLMVVDGQGRLIYHPDRNLIGQPMPPGFQPLVSGPGGTVPVRVGEQKLLLNHLRLAGMGWQVISVVPEAALLAPMAPLASAGLLVLLLCFAAIGGVAVRYSRRVVEPIRAISHGFQDIQRDRLDRVRPLVPPRAQDEIAEMVSWFNVFLDNLHARQRSEEELRQAKEAAEKASRSMGEFLANMSHEIRTPMNAILGMTQLALDARTLEERRDFVLKASRAAQSLLGILNGILDFSKIEAGKLELERVPLSLKELLAGLADVFESTAQDKGVALRFEVAPSLPGELAGDPVRLRQVLQNLIGNALKFTDTGEVTVAVEPVSEDSGGVRCRFSVRDTGVGIQPEHLPHLFQSFFQTDSSVTRRYGGTGLGLAISKRLVEMMRGRIGVESEPGKGSCFWFELPLERVAGGEAWTGPSLPVLPPGRRVLLAEDNRLNQEVAFHLLRRAGLEVVVASHGAEALELLSQGPYDLVLMDCQMPVMDGYAATRRIRAMPRFAQLPIIALTAHALEGDRERSLEAGMNDHLNKPIAAGTLYRTLERWLAKRPGGEEAPPALPSAQGPAPAEHSDHPLANQEEALGNLDGDMGLYRKVAGMFMEDAPARWAQFQEAWSGGEQETAVRAVHTLKSLAASIGAESLRQHARALEEAAREGHELVVTAGAPAAGQELARVQAALQELLRENPG